MRMFILTCTLLFSTPASAGESFAGSSMTMGGHGLYDAIVPYRTGFEAQIEAGTFDRVDPAITETRFIDDPGCDGHDPVREFALVHLDRLARPRSVIDVMRKRGLRPATLLELVAFAASYPDFQRDFPIVALRGPWRGHPDGVPRYGVVHEVKGKRVLDLERGDRRFVMSVRFLAVVVRR